MALSKLGVAREDKVLVHVGLEYADRQMCPPGKLQPLSSAQS